MSHASPAPQNIYQDFHASILVFFIFTPEIIFLDSQIYRIKGLGPAVQSLISLTSSLVVKMLTVLVTTIEFTGIFAEKKKCE